MNLWWRPSATRGSSGVRSGRDHAERGGVEIAVDGRGRSLDGGDAVGHGGIVVGEHGNLVVPERLGAPEEPDAIDLPVVADRIRQPAVLHSHRDTGRRSRGYA